MWPLFHALRTVLLLQMPFARRFFVTESNIYGDAWWYVARKEHTRHMMCYHFIGAKWPTRMINATVFTADLFVEKLRRTVPSEKGERVG